MRPSMPLGPGARLGPYEIVALLGAGGMGEVYRARDTRLDRLVAVKVLAPDLAGNAEFRARFAREAKAISALNHPHICGLYDIGRDHDTEYLVLEFLEGETLAARVARGALPLAQVLRFGIEIADALAAAHRHGIVHRDLKPANIMPPSRCKVRQRMRAPTSLLSGPSSTRWRPADARLKRRRRRASSRRWAAIRIRSNGERQPATGRERHDLIGAGRSRRNKARLAAVLVS
jgi:serine/threonine protein kinase